MDQGLSLNLLSLEKFCETNTRNLNKSKNLIPTYPSHEKGGLLAWDKRRVGFERFKLAVLLVVIVLVLAYLLVYRPTRLPPDLKCPMTESKTLEDLSSLIERELRMKRYSTYEMSDISIAMNRLSGTDLDVVSESLELFDALEKAGVAHIVVVMHLPDVAVLSVVDVDRASSVEGWSDVLKYWASPPSQSVISKEFVVKWLIQVDLPEEENAYRIFIVATEERIIEDVESVICGG